MEEAESVSARSICGFGTHFYALASDGIHATKVTAAPSGNTQEPWTRAIRMVCASPSTTAPRVAATAAAKLSGSFV